MVAMKSWSELPSIGLALIIGAALLTAGAFEVFALWQERLGLIYVGILGAEVVFIGLLSLLHFDETYTQRELAGVAIVLLGIAIRLDLTTRLASQALCVALSTLARFRSRPVTCRRYERRIFLPHKLATYRSAHMYD
jgi:hypothetical protein